MSAQDTFQSSQWYRVADVKPQLQPGTRVQRQVLRSQNWYIFSHASSRRQFRANEAAYQLIGRFDGRHSLNTLWHILQDRLGDRAPTQDDVIAVVAQFLESGLLLQDRLPDWPKLMRHRRERRRRERRTDLNPFAFRLRLCDPASLLDRLRWLEQAIFHPATILLWATLCGWAVLYALLDWQGIHAYADNYLFNSRGLILAWAIFPFMKAAHELGHALAVRHWGGEVRELGLGFFFLTPAPYVDASAAASFPGKWPRIAVSAAGMLIEAGIAALACVLWGMLEEGILKEAAFITMAIGGVATFAFNANPLWRFDGYYILCDLIGMPDLGSRSLRWWRHLLQKLAHGGSADPVRLARGTERLWLISYAPASWLARLLMFGAIAHWLAGSSAALGILAMLWLGWQYFLMPAWNIFGILAAPTGDDRRRRRAMSCAILGGGGLAAALCTIPVPANTFAAGVIWLPEHASIRTKTDAQVSAILTPDGTQVRYGQPLVQTVSPVLEKERTRLRAQLAAAEVEQAGGWQTMPQKGKDALERIEKLRRDLSALDLQHDNLILRAGVDGRFVLPERVALQDRYLLKGTLVAHVLTEEGGTVRALVSQDDIGRLQEGVRAVTARPAEGGPALHGRIVRIEPAATADLPSRALGDQGGGTLATDPADRQGRKALQPVFVVDVVLPAYRTGRVGARAVLRFEHEPAPLAALAARRLRQLFLKTFSTEGP